MKTCYYELLGVDTAALEADLKKAYRKKALQLHPDKNPGNVEEATAQFNLVRAAYEVLSDPQERAWYDSHKNQILRDDDDIGLDGNNYDGDEMVIPLISVEDIYRYFNPSMYTTFDDSSHGFYSIVNLLFERLAREEVQHGKYQNLPKYDRYKDDDSTANVTSREFLLFPRFGNSNCEFVEVKDFYGAWGNFQTVKTFNWMDEYRYSHAPDRRTRRLMERENKKLRDGARKEYNETIRKFVAFVKKRDPRYNDGLKNWEKQKRLQRQQEIEKQLLQQHQANLETLARKNNYEVQDWQQLSAKEVEELEVLLQEEYASVDTDLEFADSNDEGDLATEEENIFECIICNKSFKMERQFEVHENSNKHKKLVKKLKWEMRKEGIELGIDKDDIDLDEFETAEEDNDYDSEEKNHGDSEEEEEDAHVKTQDEGLTWDIHEEHTSRLEYEVDDVIDSDIEVEQSSFVHTPKPKKNKKKPIPEMDLGLEEVDDELIKLAKGMKLESDDDEDWSVGSNKRKVKKKRTPKESSTSTREATPLEAESKIDITVSNGAELCAICKQVFASRNKLFRHVKETGHAAPPREVQGKKKGKGKKSR
ncbi:uncharacterized protein KQ657_004758 [Scheffersomyces spartinae]|uniref:Uncharacterized protein n=1 Tax=Scheffersomyces spartinae TaxID=45513 RepID=A0A9P7VAS2_9ASCO|nr:uncharacterized protein KQ657_004758 [Scheffersomyces spartinae]KAG7194543.1 hypothetical protein KQ657_004758 [Scheffersomyces spartinae]